MSDRPRIATPAVVSKVETYVHDELADANRYDNRTPLDESGIYSLHALAADVYVEGFTDGARVEFLRADRERQRATATTATESDGLAARMRALIARWEAKAAEPTFDTYDRAAAASYADRAAEVRAAMAGDA